MKSTWKDQTVPGWVWDQFHVLVPWGGVLSAHHLFLISGPLSGGFLNQRCLPPSAILLPLVVTRTSLCSLFMLPCFWINVFSISSCLQSDLLSRLSVYSQTNDFTLTCCSACPPDRRVNCGYISPLDPLEPGSISPAYSSPGHSHGYPSYASWPASTGKDIPSTSTTELNPLTCFPVQWYFSPLLQKFLPVLSLCFPCPNLSPS